MLDNRLDNLDHTAMRDPHTWRTLELIRTDDQIAVVWPKQYRRAVLRRVAYSAGGPPTRLEADILQFAGHIRWQVM